MSRLVLSKRRGISEIIGTLMLLAITTIGSFFLASIVQGSGFGSVDPSATQPVSPVYSIRLTGYDTRDSVNLSGILSLDNKFDQRLCAKSCAGFANNVPNTGGTDFIIVQIKNISTAPVYIKNLQINGVTHVMDSQTAGKSFDAGADDFSGKYPMNGKFSIISSGGLVQKSDDQLSDDEEVTLIVKLSKDASDISLSKPIQVMVNFGSVRSAEFVILSGETR